jgi:hypothetical protein
MGGGLMQLVAYGAQDIYLTGNPQITFFKVVYRRHTNFSMETIQQTLNGGGSGDITTGSATCTISRNGDLVHKVYVTADSAQATNGSALVQEVELEIGGQRIDRHYQQWNEVWNELSTPESKAVALKAMQCEIGAGNDGGVETIQIPLNFWFCRNPGLALPLIALQYHEVKLKFKWGNVQGGGVTPEVYCDYIYLDTDERRRFAQVSHEYLIEQLQKGDYTQNTDTKLNFNHPVKELIWVNSIPNPVGVKYQLKLNGHDRFKEQPKDYFMLRQPFDYHTAVPRQNLPPAAQLTSNMLNPGADQFTRGTLIPNANVGGQSPNTVLASQQIAIGTITGTLGDSSSEVFVPTNSTSLTPQDAIYVVRGSDLLSADFRVGSLYKITVTGSSSAHGSDTGSLDIFTVVTTNQVGANNISVGDGIATNNTVLQFDKLLTADADVTISASSDATVFSITAAKLMTPDSNVATEARTSKMNKEINVYSFALKPEEHQPSGTCNFSRIDNAQLKVTGNDGGGTIYAVNYNVLRIMSGMGGLAYSN